MNNQMTPLAAAPDPDAWLVVALRSAQLPVLPDDGFTNAVLERLPPQPQAVQWQSELAQRQQRERRYLRFSLGGLLLGGAVALVTTQWPDTQQIAEAVVALFDHRAATAQVLAPWLASLLCAGLLAYVLADGESAGFA